MIYTTILFDFDGTLTHSLPAWLSAYQYAFLQFGISLSAEEVVERCFYRTWQDVVEEWRLPSVHDFGEHVRVGLESAMPDALLFEGVTDVLDRLAGCGVNMGIVTSSTGTVVRRFLEAKNLSGYFGSVVTADDITNFKPHPEPVFLALAQLGGLPEDSLFVGDSSVDMMAAGNAGLHKALFLPEEHNIFYDFEDLRSHQPHYVFHTYDELLPKLSAKQ